MVCVQLEDGMSDGVHIWRAALDEAGWSGTGRLPATERERAASFLREEASRRWVAARWALRRVLAEYLDEAAADVELQLDKIGKPRLRKAHGIGFSLSHSNGLALVAVTEGREVGVDVELIVPGRDFIALAERTLDPDDAAAVREAPAAQRAWTFYPAWVRHEARFKCLGDTSLRSSTSEVPDRRLAVAGLDVAPGYAAAVAVAAAEVGPIDCRSLRAG